MTDSKKKSIFIYRKNLLLLIAAALVVLVGFIGYRWYKVSHPYSYVSFTTFAAPRDQQPQDVMLHLQGYTQDIFSFGHSYLPQKISLTYTLPKEELRITQTKASSSSLTEAQCNQEMNTESCTMAKTESGQPFMELRDNSDNSDGHIQAIFLQKDTTLIRAQPTDTNQVISDDEWRAIVTTTFADLEAKSFQGSPYRFFDSWNI